jgi:hypothetical protein
VVRRQLVNDHGANTAVESLIIDGVVLSYYHMHRVNGWITHLELAAETEMFGAASGNLFLRMNVASNLRVRTPECEWRDKTQWVRVTVLGRRAETLAQHLKKGMCVFVEGRLKASRHRAPGIDRLAAPVRRQASVRSTRMGPCSMGIKTKRRR